MCITLMSAPIWNHTFCINRNFVFVFVLHTWLRVCDALQCIATKLTKTYKSPTEYIYRGKKRNTVISDLNIFVAYFQEITDVIENIKEIPLDKMYYHFSRFQMSVHKNGIGDEPAEYKPITLWV